MPTRNAFIHAARVPHEVKPQAFGSWKIGREKPRDLAQYLKVNFDDYTLLGKGDSCSKRPYGDIVMEDTWTELERHMPIWVKASGKVLITGLGLGCVVRGLLASPKVKHIDVIEIDPWIVKTIGKEFKGNPKVEIHCCDAFEFNPGSRTWNYAWHDIYTEEGNGLPLAKMHTYLIHKFGKHVKTRQGGLELPERGFEGTWTFTLNRSKSCGNL